MTIGERIKERRLAKSLTQEDLAKRIKTSKQTIQRYEAGIISNIPSNKIEAMADVLGVTPAYLLGWETPFTAEDDIMVDPDTNKFFSTKEEQEKFFDMYRFRITKGYDQIVKCYLTEDQKNILISMINSWAVENLETGGEYRCVEPY